MEVSRTQPQAVLGALMGSEGGEKEARFGDEGAIDAITLLPQFSNLVTPQGDCPNPPRPQQ